ncbi:MAG: DUF342 domain-containing protein [Chitinivibrionales bacterium]|nr:DUF342 domain-containing protein [Chitinivibrionales bacterium]
MSRSVIVQAANFDEALTLGADQLQLALSEVGGELVEDCGDGMLSVKVFANTDVLSRESEEMLTRLEKEVYNIETAEILEGLTAEEMQQKGLLGDGEPLTVDRSMSSSARREGEYEFGEGVEYAVRHDVGKIENVSLADVEYLHDVKIDQHIATRKLSGYSLEKKGADPSAYHKEDYFSNNNVRIEFAEDRFYYHAKVNGKVVLLPKGIYVIDSDRDAIFELHVSADRLTALMDIHPAKGTGRKLTGDAITNGLKLHNIIYGIQRAAIDEALKIAQESGDSQLNIVAARGSEPVNGKDAQAIFSFDDKQNDEELRILPDGRVDYRKRANIKTVRKGDLLASVSPAEDGTDGTDIYDKRVTARDGDNKVLYQGENVTVAEDGAKFFAACDGQPVVNKNVLHVFKHYHVPGDVDYRTGNIDFCGSVTVKGNILPDFEVIATGDITVVGNIDCGMVKAGRNLKVLGGIIGNGETVISCGRNLIATHLQNAIVEVQGDVEILNSSVHSKIYSTGNVACKHQKGTVVGGLISALKSIEIKIAGSLSGTKTELTAGHDFLIKKAEREFKTAFDFCERNIKKLADFLKPFYALLKKGSKLDAGQKMRIATIVQKQNELKKHREIMEAKIKHIRMLATRSANSEILVARKVYPDVKLTVGQKTFHCLQEYGYSRFFIDNKSNELQRSTGR